MSGIHLYQKKKYRAQATWCTAVLDDEKDPYPVVVSSPSSRYAALFTKYKYQNVKNRQKPAPMTVRGFRHDDRRNACSPRLVLIEE